MTEVTRELPAVFDALSPMDQQQVTAEILRRAAGSGELPEVALHELADELCRR
jgi:hypothetical protein